MKKLFRRISVVFLSFAILLSLFPVSAFSVDKSNQVWDGSVADSFFGGTGTQADPYIISTAAELARFESLVNSGNETICGELNNDIILNEKVLKEDGTLVTNSLLLKKWQPIAYYHYDSINGETSYYYRGVFDGKGHTISGIYYKDTSEDYIGLFGEIEDSTIKNLNIIDSYIKARSSVGGITGELGSNSIIENCSFNGSVNGSTSNIGGIAGELVSTGSIINCTFFGSVDGQESNIGGMCGYASGTIKNCTNYGKIAAAESVGGICGITNNSLIENCINTGAVNGSSSRIGGVSGENYGGTISLSCNYGRITGASSVGGICGINSSEDSTIKNCYYDSSASTGYNGSGNVINLVSRSASQFASGEVAYSLQSYQQKDATGTAALIWGQSSLNDGSYPILTNNEKYRVLPVFNSEGKVLSYLTNYMGDCNNDNVVNADDYLELKNIVVGITALGGENDRKRFASDLNGDGVSDAFDLSNLDLLLSGLKTSL